MFLNGGILKIEYLNIICSDSSWSNRFLTALSALAKISTKSKSDQDMEKYHIPKLCVMGNIKLKST